MSNTNTSLWDKWFSSRPTELLEKLSCSSVEILNKIGELIKMADANAAALADLQNELAAFKTSVSNQLAAIAAKLQASANSPSDISAAVEQTVTDLKTLQGQIDTSTTSLS